MKSTTLPRLTGDYSVDYITIDQRFSRLEERLDILETKVNALVEKVNTMEEILISLVAKVDMIMNILDKQTVMLLRIDNEYVFTNERMGRIEKHLPDLGL